MRPETVWLLIFLQISENQLNGFENGKTQLFNSGGVVKWAYFKKKKKWSIPLRINKAYEVYAKNDISQRISVEDIVFF